MPQSTLHFRISDPEDLIQLPQHVPGDVVVLKKVVVLFKDALNSITSFNISIPWLNMSHSAIGHNNLPVTLPYQPAERYHGETYDLEFRINDNVPRVFTTQILNATGVLAADGDFESIDLFFHVY